MFLQQRVVTSKSARSQAKCKMIGAVVTSSGTDCTSPIVGILGWNLSQHRHLAKFSEMFEKKGFDTARITSTLNNTVLRLNRAKEITAHQRIVGYT